MCKVVNKYKEPYDVYIGRGSKWGNPYTMKDKSDEERSRVIKEYKNYLWKSIKEEVISIEDLKSLEGKTLGCFCSPKPCHGDVISLAVEWALAQK